MSMSALSSGDVDFGMVIGGGAMGAVAALAGALTESFSAE